MCTHGRQDKYLSQSRAHLPCRGRVAPLVRVPWAWLEPKSVVTSGLNQSCVCNLARLLMKEHLFESQNSLDIDQRQRTAVLNIWSDLWQLDVYRDRYSSQSHAHLSCLGMGSPFGTRCQQPWVWLEPKCWSYIWSQLKTCV